MGFLDKVLAGGAIAIAGAVARSMFKDAQETARRKASPLRFDEELTQAEFVDLVREVAKRTPRVEDASVAGMSITIRVGSISGLSSWAAELDFNDYGRLTGTYWLNSQNSDSLIPGHFADAVQAEVQRRRSLTLSQESEVPSVPHLREEALPPAGWYPDSPQSFRWWNGSNWTSHVHPTPR